MEKQSTTTKHDGEQTEKASTNNAYFYEKELGKKHKMKVPCTLCASENSGVYFWLLKRKDEERDFVKHVCLHCRETEYGVSFHETIYGKVIKLEKDN